MARRGNPAISNEGAPVTDYIELADRVNGSREAALWSAAEFSTIPGAIMAHRDHLRSTKRRAAVQ